jgi:hypothetical protein
MASDADSSPGILTGQEINTNRVDSVETFLEQLTVPSPKDFDLFATITDA